MSFRRALAAAAVGCLICALLPPSVASAATTCLGAKATVKGTSGKDNLKGTSGDDIIAGLGGNDVIDGRGGSDVICGGAGNDVIDGGSGGDILLGGAGNDDLKGGKSQDSLEGNGGSDHLDGGAGDSDFVNFTTSPTGVTANLTTGVATGEGSDKLSNLEVLQGTDHDDDLTGTDGNNGIFAEGGNDALHGGGGDADALVPGPGNDIVDGGEGTLDTVFYRFSATAVTVDLGQSTATGEGNDTLTGIEGVDGSPFADTLTGSAGSDALVGEEGNDQLSSGDGDDIILGGAGNDTMDGGAGTVDILSFGFATGPVTVDLQAGTATGEGTDSITGFEVVDGSPFDDHLTGDNEQNSFYPEEGNDTVDGAGGFDSTYFSFATGPVTASIATGTASGQGNDLLSNMEGLAGSLFDDVLTGDDNPNMLSGNDGNDILDGAGDDDYFYGGAGNDQITGGGGNFDVLDLFYAGNPIIASIATGGSTGQGTDSFNGIEALSGSDAYGDTLSGGPGEDFLYGEGGDDTLAGAAGDDDLSGGADTDTLDGGPGTDNCSGVENGTSCEQSGPSAVQQIKFDSRTAITVQRRFSHRFSH